MKIRIENLGAIKLASIDLDKKLTVFCGPNNTGKTYLSYVIYALKGSSISPAEHISEDHTKYILENKSVLIPIDTEKVYLHKQESAEELKKNIDGVFGISDNDAEKLFKDLSISYITSKEDCKHKVYSMSYDNEFGIANLKFNLKKESNSYDVLVTPFSSNDYSSNEFISSILPSAIHSMIYNRTSLYPINQSAIFPVERNSIYTFNKELSLSRNALIDQMQKLSKGEKINPFDLMEQGSKRYPEAIKDGLRIANDLNTINKEKGTFFDIAQEIEFQLLDGLIDVSKDGDVVFRPSKASSKKTGTLPIHMTASIVKTLSSLVFYLKYLAEKDELIIIDEPEMNLHPNSQIILVKILVKLMNHGLRLLISTHSDYIIREINNYIITDSLISRSKSIPENLSWDASNRINRNDVGVYYFDFASKKKVVVNNLKVDESGFEVVSIDKSIVNQNNTAEELFYALKYSDKND